MKQEFEIWKPVVGYEGLYEVSNLGRVKSLERKVNKLHGERTVQERILKPLIKEDGYYRVELWKGCSGKKYYIHRLVAQVFLSNPKNYPDVNHKDENKSNNNVENLEFCSTKYNNNYGTKNRRASLAQSKPIMCVETGVIYQCKKDAEKHLGMNTKTHIIDCCNGKLQTCCGFHWKYV